MKTNSYRVITMRLAGLVGLLVMIHSCQNEYFVPHPRPVPKTPQPTAQLEAHYVTEAPASLTHFYWKTADYLPISVKDLSTSGVYSEDGLLNANGTYDGLAGFNTDDSIDLRMMAAYTDDKLYILIEWTDDEQDASRAAMLHNGHEDPLRPLESADGWTSQRNDDQMALAFNISDPDFNSVGCLSACHSGTMEPTTGSIDIWNWSVALSDPFGYALDQRCEAGSGIANDAGLATYVSNLAGSGYRSGPAYEWNGERQDVEKPDGTKTILDPAFYLLNKTAFTGSPDAGQGPYEMKCGETCHGVDGEGFGPDLDGPPFNKPGVMNRKSRQTLIDFASSSEHSGQTAFNELSPTEIENVLAKIRGFTGVPGYYLQQPDGSAADIVASSNVLSARIEPEGKRYRVLLVRNLKTNNADDIQFDLDTKTDYTFGIALMDADGKNHVGSVIETLNFIKP